MRAPCSVAGCERERQARGLCKMHWKRWRNGIPLDQPMQPRYNGALCYVEDCDKPAKSKGLCNTHRARIRRYGTLDTAIAPRGSGGSHGVSGYRVVMKHGHPVAGKSGKAFEHRVVLFDSIGPGEHPCNWCGDIVTWDHRQLSEPDVLVVDHVNAIRDDNRPENLVPSCLPCNAARTQTGKPKPRKAAAQ